MKKTLTAHEIANHLLADDNARWSRPAAFALADYFLNFEEETGEELELDVVAIRCEWSEYDTAQDIAEAYGIDIDDPEEVEETVLDYLDGRTDVITLDNGNGYLVRQF